MEFKKRKKKILFIVKSLLKSCFKGIFRIIIVNVEIIENIKSRKNFEFVYLYSLFYIMNINKKIIKNIKFI